MTMQEYLRSLPKIKWCGKCSCMVNKWHKHWGLCDFTAYPKGFEK